VLSHLWPWRASLIGFALLLVTGALQPTWAQAGDAAAEQADFWRLLWFGAGWFGFMVMGLLAVCSVAALALVIENLLSIRRRVLIPAGLPEKFQHHLTQGEGSKAEQVCRDQPSFLATMLLAGLHELRHGYDAVEKAMEETAQDLNARLHRKIEYLSLLSSIGPMLGLLGTVWGMVVAFQKVAETQGRADPSQLAGGIYQALYTTVFGLVIAIPGFACYGILRNRVDQLSAECAVLAERLFAPLKRVRASRRAPETTSGVPGQRYEG
jgi:biopolymer transport protein ExbB